MEYRCNSRFNSCPRTSHKRFSQICPIKSTGFRGDCQIFGQIYAGTGCCIRLDSAKFMPFRAVALTGRAGAASEFIALLWLTSQSGPNSGRAWACCRFPVFDPVLSLVQAMPAPAATSMSTCSRACNICSLNETLGTLEVTMIRIQSLRYKHELIGIKIYTSYQLMTLCLFCRQ